jgi:hypothetical protein
MQPNPETTRTTCAATEVSVLQSARDLIILQHNSLFPNTLPLTLLNRRLCELKQGYLTHNPNAFNILKDEVRKKLRAHRGEPVPQLVTTHFNDPHWQAAET